MTPGHRASSTDQHVEIEPRVTDPGLFLCIRYPTLDRVGRSVAAMRKCPKCGRSYSPNRPEQKFCRRNCGRWRHHTAIEERLDDRPPADQREAYLAGLIATDGYIETRRGRAAPTGLAIKMAAQAKPLLAEIAAHYGRALYQRSNGQFVVTFVDKPVVWKQRPPKIRPDWLPDYVRGLFDGDGCISGARVGFRFYPYVSLSFNPAREQWIGEIYARFLTSHGITFSEQREKPTLIQVRTWGEAAVEFVRIIYDRPGWAHPAKGAHARAMINGRAGDWPLHFVPRRQGRG